MPRTISAAQARNNFADLIGEAHFGNEVFVIERLGKPFAVLIGFQEYQKMLESHKRERQKSREASEQGRLL